MTIKEAILKVLEDHKGSFTYLEVLKMIDAKNYIDWTNAKTPSDTIGAQLGHFIRQDDSRVKRIKGKKGFEYYLSKYENELNLSAVVAKETNSKKDAAKKYQERDLHKLLSSYLKSQNIYSKTIFHEKSSNSKDDHQKWVHPDMIGIHFLNLKNKSSNALLKVINKADAFDLISYELKREIKSDYELKKCFFQAVSNSSWANYGYLVAFHISRNLLDELERLNQSFGIGIIELSGNPYESKVLFQPKFKELDFKTMDKLCEINSEFEKFISQTETLLIAPEKYLKGIRKEFETFCDDYFKTDSEIEKYCNTKNIPYEEEKTV
ncbi:HTH domain-containing protein [Aureispira anguillae]|uniref:HTH domain-containing protein n=1 Tax=Aureispira anguillae TaxID=2864201 RepID=A0A916DQX1_9BACT|nr:HTH domain-containing protein [Aureispira anguillae]BDS11439.1 HTH domain-containing protein [Aureispira anguillae]